MTARIILSKPTLPPLQEFAARSFAARVSAAAAAIVAEHAERAEAELRRTIGECAWTLRGDATFGGLHPATASPQNIRGAEG